MKKLITITILSVFLALTACDKKFSGVNPMNSEAYESSEVLGSGSYTVKATDLVESASLADLSDEEIIEDHIKMMEQVLENLKNDKFELPEGAKAMKEDLIADLEKRIELIKNDEAAQAAFVKKMRAIFETIQDQELPEVDENGKFPVNCEFLKKVLEDNSNVLNEEARALEEERYKTNCT